MTALPSLKYISPKPIAPAYPDYLFMRAGLAVAPAETLEIFAFLQAMKESRAQNGAVVTLKK